LAINEAEFQFVVSATTLPFGRVAIALRSFGKRVKLSVTEPTIVTVVAALAGLICDASRTKTPTAAVITRLNIWSPT
jgi:hypothetical protein